MKRAERPISWLPIDSRLITPFFSFSNVKGWPRVFLTIEMICATLVVLGTMVLAVLAAFSKGF